MCVCVVGCGSVCVCGVVLGNGLKSVVCVCGVLCVVCVCVGMDVRVWFVMLVLCVWCGLGCKSVVGVCVCGVCVCVCVCVLV